MRVIPLPPILLALTVMVDAQTHIKNKYLDSNLYFTPKRKSVYTLFVTQEANHWIARAHYHDGSLVLNISFQNEKLTIKDGPYVLYYPDGSLRQRGSFKNNKVNGPWQSWYENGQMQDSGKVNENHFSGLWKHWYANGQLKSQIVYTMHRDTSASISNADNEPHKTPADKAIITNVQVTGWHDGPWQSWYSNGMPEATGVYKNDSLDGVWKWFRENGQASTVETYTNGKITQLECYDENGKFTGNSCSILKPAVFTHPFFSPRQYITEQLRKLYNLQRADVGRVDLRFIVNKTGRLTHLVMNGADFVSRNCIYYIIATMPAWSPAVSHNRPLDYIVSLTIY